jgi:hypothetical protein
MWVSLKGKIKILLFSKPLDPCHHISMSFTSNNKSLQHLFMEGFYNYQGSKKLIHCLSAIISMDITVRK